MATFPPEGTVLYEPGAGIEQVRDITVMGEGAGHNGLVGFFRDDAADAYFMVVNLRHGEGLAAADAPLAITLQFAPSVERVARLSRETGAVEMLPVPDGTLTLTLPGGTGDLFKTDDSRFPGLESE